VKIKCKTQFDITVTGVTGHYKSARIPFRLRTGEVITNMEEWNRARNQQRNWETLTQIIGLRTQIFDVTDPVYENGLWEFEFVTETPGVFGAGDNPFSVLIEDATGVPMLRELENDIVDQPILVPNTNIWFELIPINNTLENFNG
jgi:hypothetical protein